MKENSELYDLKITEEVPWSLFLSKAFVRPEQTPEAELARLLDRNLSFNFKETLFYKIRSGRINPFIAFPHLGRCSAVWWNMPWLNVPERKRITTKSDNAMNKLLSSFIGLFESIKSKGFIVDSFDLRIRVDKLIKGNKVCYIYVDANKRMGILSHLRSSGQLTVDKIPVKVARIATSASCSWMDLNMAESLFNYPFDVLDKEKIKHDSK